MSRMEEIIAEIEDYLENCKFQPLSNSKIVVNKDELEELIDELRNRTPEEVKRYQKIIANKDAILSDAQAKANDIIAQAQARANEMVSENEITQQAYAQANEIVGVASNQAQEILDKATEDANNIRTAAIEYTDNLLENMETIISHSLNLSTDRFTDLNNSLQGCLDIVVKNRAELVPAAPDEAAAADNGINIIAGE